MYISFCVHYIGRIVKHVQLDQAKAPKGHVQVREVKKEGGVVWSGFGIVWHGVGKMGGGFGTGSVTVNVSGRVANGKPKFFTQSAENEYRTNL